MADTDRIVEEVVKTADTPWLAEHFHQYSLQKDTYAYCLSVDRGNGRELVRSFTFSEPTPERLGVVDGFRKHLAGVRPDGFWDYIFALDTYDHLCPESRRFRTDEPEPRLSSEASAVVEPILAQSRGFVLWHFQLEHLIGLFDNRAERCRTLRKDFNAKRPSAEAWMSKQMIDENTTLYDLAVGRTMISGTWVPSLEGARVICRALARIAQEERRLTSHECAGS